jgi:diguanylate cyclase (GGDEF)-like protein
VVFALAIAIPALTWFAVGPLDLQRYGSRIATPILAGMIAVGQWRIGRQLLDELPAPTQRTTSSRGADAARLRIASARFWRILAVGMGMYTAGMLVDLTALLVGFSRRDLGEVVFYPIAGIFSVVALVVFPTVGRERAERVKIVLDVVTVLLGFAIFVWYFLVSQRWRPADGWNELSDGLILPAITLVAGFVILRITLAGASVVGRPTMICFVFGALCAATPIVIGAPPDTNLGRLVSAMYVLGLTACVIGVALQRQAGATPVSVLSATWRRRFAFLPYAVVVATLVLLLLVVFDTDIDYRGWLVVIGVLLLGSVVMVRQLASLWENSRLLTANQSLTERLRHQAFHDSLTGLTNRMLFTDRVTEALGYTDRVAVLFIDLDDFKLVNDSLGHDIGDRLLVEVAHRLRAALPAEHVLGRLGGDEFALLIEDADAQPCAEAVINALREPFDVAGFGINLRASIGVATTDGPAAVPLDAAALLRNADVAMYAAKHEHKGGWRAFQPPMLAALLHRHELQAALVDAIDRDEFAVFYQPIVRLVDGKLHGAEALVRWVRADGSMLLPGVFIPLAEETGLIADIDRLVLRRACHQAARWRAEQRGGPDGDDSFALHVNLSARLLHRPDLPGDVEAILSESGLPADRLTLEITESGLGHDHEGATERLRELSRLGVRLAIDDFGTGYSSLGYLQRMPVDVLKIDKAFTAELAGAAKSAPLARIVVALAQTLRMETVAEGIEGPDQADRLLGFGCQYGQGFHYAEPLPAEELAELLDRSSLPLAPVTVARVADS